MDNALPLSNDLLEAFLKIDHKKKSLMKVKNIKFTPLSKGENYISEAHRLEVLYLRCDGAFVTEYYFLKLAPTTPIKRKYVDNLGLIHKEIKVYTELLPQMELLIHSVGDYTELLWPKCIASVCYDLILMEDLISRGYNKCDKRIGLDLEHSILVLKAIAKFHAITVALKDKMLIDLKTYQSFGFTEKNKDLTKLIENRLTILADLMKNWGREWQNLRKSIEENADIGHHIIIKSCKFNAHNFNVVIHGDVWTSNILFKRCSFTGNLCGVKYEQDGRFVRQVEARAVWNAIIESQVETGVPYMLYKDSCNRKSNQQNLGTIKCSNLCTEIIEYTSPDEVAVCNLASIALNKFVRQDKSYDFKKLKEVTKIITRNLNKIIDVNYYPIVEARRSNMLHRPIGIGVQGLADLFIQMRIPFESDAAQELNKQIFETIYYGALEASYELAQLNGTYETYQGSPASKGILQYDMWNVTPSTLWDWAALKEKITEHGLRNSLLLAPMPTASTAQILGNNESFEPFTTNIYTRRVLSGEFQVVNHHLLRDLVELKLWNEDMKNELIKNNGSVQNIKGIPDDLKTLYKTVWEISQKTILKMAADRGAFIDQSQSLNIHIAEPNYGKLTSMHFYAWKLGLKTGMYYLRTKPAAQAIQFTVDKSKTNLTVENGNKSLENGKTDMAAYNMASMVCSLENKDECLMCGS